MLRVLENKPSGSVPANICETCDRHGVMNVLQNFSQKID
jgi:hypothetical protein